MDKKTQNFTYRVVFENSHSKITHAIYLSDWKEGLKLRDFSIVATAIKEGGMEVKVRRMANKWKVGHATKVGKREGGREEEHEEEEGGRRREESGGKR